MSGVYVGERTGRVRVAVFSQCEVSSCRSVLMVELESRGLQGSHPAGTVRARYTLPALCLYSTQRVALFLDLPGPVRAYLSLYPSCGPCALVPEPVPCLLHGARRASPCRRDACAQQAAVLCAGWASEQGRLSLCQSACQSVIFCNKILAASLLQLPFSSTSQGPPTQTSFSNSKLQTTYHLFRLRRQGAS